MATVNAEKLAKVLNLTESRVHQLVKEGLPKEARGQFDVMKCVQFYIRYLQRALEKKSVPMGDGYAGERQERIRLLRADADLREIELAKERGQLVAIDDVEREFVDLILTTKSRILAVAPRLAPELLGETSQVMVHAKTDKALKEALLALSKRERKTPST